MSRIGKKIIELPAKVKLNISGEGAVSAEGPKGKLAWTLPKQIKGQAWTASTSNRARPAKIAKCAPCTVFPAPWSITSSPASPPASPRIFEIQGVGFKAAVKGAILDLNLGFSHDVHFTIPEGIKITVAENTKIKIEGIDRQLVGQVAADIRAYYPPEPYKGKGVRYAGEQIQRKEGKTVQ